MPVRLWWQSWSPTWGLGVSSPICPHCYLQPHGLWGLVAVSTDNPSLQNSHSLTMEATTLFPSLLLPPSSNLPNVSPLSSPSQSSSPLHSPSLSSSPLLSSSLSFSHYTRLALAREEEKETGPSSWYTALCIMIVQCTLQNDNKLQCDFKTKARKGLTI